MDGSLPSMSSSKSDMELMAEQISIPALEALACRHGTSRDVIVHDPPMYGSYNLVYILSFPDGRKWVGRIPAPDTSDTLLMQSTIHTIRLIRDKTNIPVPCIHAYDVSSNNELGMPYVFMDFVHGVPLGRLWKDENIMSDVARRHIFEQVASSMSQLNVLKFDKIGHLQYDEVSGTYSVGPYRRLKFSLRSDVSTIEECGPFTTTHAFFSDLVQSLINSPNHTTIIFCLLRLLVLSLPDPRYDGAPFVLSHPDFDSQNVMVDPATLKVTGFIDWDGVCAGPRSGGFARYPAWITRDWDPFVYDWHEPKAETAESNGDAREGGGEEAQEQPLPTSKPASSAASSFLNDEESPDTLQRHRDLYLSIYSAIDPGNADITRQSHVFEALQIALHSPELAADILGKLCAHVFDSEIADCGSLLMGIEHGDWLKGLQQNPSHASKEHESKISESDLLQSAGVSI